MSSHYGEDGRIWELVEGLRWVEVQKGVNRLISCQAFPRIIPKIVSSVFFSLEMRLVAFVLDGLGVEVVLCLITLLWVLFVLCIHENNEHKLNGYTLTVVTNLLKAMTTRHKG